MNYGEAHLSSPTLLCHCICYRVTTDTSFAQPSYPSCTCLLISFEEGNSFAYRNVQKLKQLLLSKNVAIKFTVEFRWKSLNQSLFPLIFNQVITSTWSAMDEKQDMVNLWICFHLNNDYEPFRVHPNKHIFLSFSVTSIIDE